MLTIFLNIKSPFSDWFRSVRHLSFSETRFFIKSHVKKVRNIQIGKKSRDLPSVALYSLLELLTPLISVLSFQVGQAMSSMFPAALYSILALLTHDICFAFPGGAGGVFDLPSCPLLRWANPWIFRQLVYFRLSLPNF